MVRGPVAKRLARGSLHPRLASAKLVIPAQAGMQGPPESWDPAVKHRPWRGGGAPALAPYHRTVPTQTTQFAQFAIPYQEQLFRSL
jgi:hypothetical protein